MATATIKNDKEFPVTVTFKDGDDDSTVVLQPGEEVTVPEEAADDVATQIADATEATADGDEYATDGDGTGDTADEGDTTDGEDAQTELSRVKLENAELKLSRDFDALLAEGKVIPAQKDKILALAKLSQGIQLSTGSDTKTNVAAVVLDILRSGKQQFSTDESGSSKEDEDATDKQDQSDEGKKPSETLSEGDLEGLKALGVSPEKMDELAEKDPLYARTLASLSKK